MARLGPTIGVLYPWVLRVAGYGPINLDTTQFPLVTKCLENQVHHTRTNPQAGRVPVLFLPRLTHTQDPGCHTQFLCQNQVLIICMTQDQLFHIYGPKVFTDNQMSRIKYNYYISNLSKDYDDSQRNRTVEDSIIPQERQLEQHVT
jgi:hypothetical protein